MEDWIRSVFRIFFVTFSSIRFTFWFCKSGLVCFFFNLPLTKDGTPVKLQIPSPYGLLLWIVILFTKQDFDPPCFWIPKVNGKGLLLDRWVFNQSYTFMDIFIRWKKQLFGNIYKKLNFQIIVFPLSIFNLGSSRNFTHSSSQMDSRLSYIHRVFHILTFMICDLFSN